MVEPQQKKEIVALEKSNFSKSSTINFLFLNSISFPALFLEATKYQTV
jgi:GTP-binding protein EngB required for normal cell division